MRPIGMVILVAAAAGCATTPVPADKYARARASITSAEVMKVEQVPNAATYLRSAREELEQAKSLMVDGDNDRASFVLLRAEADGEAALNIAREAWARQEALQTIEQVRQAKGQMQMQLQQQEGPRHE